MKKIFELIENEIDEKWKIGNKRYLFEVQKFLDVAENIEDEELQKILISQMLKCDKILTIIAKEMFEKIRSENMYKI